MGVVTVKEAGVDRDDLRLSRIDTLWSVVRKAHDAGGPSVATAQERLVERYGGAVRRYLMASLRDPEAVEEVFQEFALNLVRGAFKRADPGHGRFRQFVKTAIFHLIVDYRRREHRRAAQKPLDPDAPDAPADWQEPLDADRAFLASWRDELLARTWNSLEAFERNTGKPCYTVLRFRLDHAGMRSPEMAQRLSEQTGKPLSAGALRTQLHRARETFAELLLDAVLDSLDDASLDAAEEELIELNLLDYCRSALQSRRGPT